MNLSFYHPWYGSVEWTCEQYNYSDPCSLSMLNKVRSCLPLQAQSLNSKSKPKSLQQPSRILDHLASLPFLISSVLLFAAGHFSLIDLLAVFLYTKSLQGLFPLSGKSPTPYLRIYLSVSFSLCTSFLKVH